jgi:hypothetical protein
MNNNAYSNFFKTNFLPEPELRPEIENSASNAQFMPKWLEIIPYTLWTMNKVCSIFTNFLNSFFLPWSELTPEIENYSFYTNEWFI